MWKGTVVSIQIGPERGKPLSDLKEVDAEKGFGLVGDRNHKAPDGEPGKRQITLVAEEELAKGGLTSMESRRNITVRGVPLNDLLGKRLRIGDVIVEATKLCEPCDYMVKLAGKPEALKPMAGRAGLCGMILTSGKIRVGDPVVPE